MEERESDIVRAICDYLAYRKVFFWRANTAPTVNKSKEGWSFRRMPKHALKGVPDIIVIKAGQFIGLEVKREKGKLSLDQVEFRLRAEAAGAKYYIVRSIDDVRVLGL